MRKKGFTLVELLVVIAIIALLMGILMPALARVRQLAYRMVCGTNLSGIGKAMVLYANDHKEEFPIAGCTCAMWDNTGRVANFADSGNRGYPGIFNECTPEGTWGKATIGASFYLLVKYADVTVKQFNCKGDVGVKTFKLSEWTIAKNLTDYTRAWDFGHKPGLYNSYSYHMPYCRKPSGGDPVNGFPVSLNSNPASPVAADRSPFLDTNAKYLLSSSGSAPVEATLAADELAKNPTAKTPLQYWPAGQASEYKDPEKTINSAAHQREGQNVLYVDNSVAFAKTANVGVDKDNIWSMWPAATLPVGNEGKRQRECGNAFPAHDRDTANPGVPAALYMWPMSPTDAVLVNEPQNAGPNPN